MSAIRIVNLPALLLLLEVIDNVDVNIYQDVVNSNCHEGVQEKESFEEGSSYLF